MPDEVGRGTRSLPPGQQREVILSQGALSRIIWLCEKEIMSKTGLFPLKIRTMELEMMTAPGKPARLDR